MCRSQQRRRLMLAGGFDVWGRWLKGCVREPQRRYVPEMAAVRVPCIRVWLVASWHAPAAQRSVIASLSPSKIYVPGI
jgi:hypothetical protein